MQQQQQQQQRSGPCIHNCINENELKVGLYFGEMDGERDARIKLRAQHNENSHNRVDLNQQQPHQQQQTDTIYNIQTNTGINSARELAEENKNGIQPDTSDNKRKKSDPNSNKCSDRFFSFLSNAFAN